MSDCPKFIDITEAEQEWVDSIWNKRWCGKASQPKFPSKLYMYKNININTVFQIEEQKVHLSSPIYFNDPYDCFHMKYVVGKLLEIEREKDDFINNNFESAHCRLTTTVLQNLRISCVSERNDNFLMWSYYNQHRGICIEYDYAQFLNMKQKDKKDIEYRLFPVIYTNEIYKIFPFITVANELQNNATTLIALCKIKEWQQEREWRLINMAENIPSDGFINFPISSIYYGVNIDPLEEKVIENSVKNLDIPLFKARLSSARFGLEFDPC